MIVATTICASGSREDVRGRFAGQYAADKACGTMHMPSVVSLVAQAAVERTWWQLEHDSVCESPLRTQSAIERDVSQLKCTHNLDRELDHEQRGKGVEDWLAL